MTDWLLVAIDRTLALLAGTIFGMAAAWLCGAPGWAVGCVGMINGVLFVLLHDVRQSGGAS